MLDTWGLSTFCLRMPHICSIGFRSGDMFFGKQFLKGGYHLLLQNVTVHVGIRVSLNEKQLSSTSSSHAAPDHDATTTMLECKQGTIFLVLLTRASSHMLDTIWFKQVYLRLTRIQDMVLVIHALGQVVFSKLFAGFFVSQLHKRLPSGTTCNHANQLVAVCGV